MSDVIGTSTEVKNESMDQASYEAEMIAKAEGAEAKSLEKDSDQFGNTTTEDEQLLAGKYKNTEELEKAYKELESRLGKSEEPKEDTTAPAKELTKSEAEEIVASKGLDFEGLNEEFATNGKLSEETYKSLADKGVTKETVDAYIKGQEALAQQEITKLQSVIGGEANFNSMMEWATENLSQDEKNYFNKVIVDEASAQFAIKGLYARYKAEAEPSFIEGNGNATSNRGYQSSREMMSDMASPKYKNDPAFRKMVEQKIARSKF